MLRALIFDVDGTLADTEAAHLAAFNQAFQEAGMDWHWDVAQYTELLAISGGKERLTHFWHQQHPDIRALNSSALHDTIARLHELKTAAYEQAVQRGEVQMRPGVLALIEEASAQGLALAIATPVAIGIAVFITELCPARLRQPLVFLTELLAAIPSIVYGLWGIFVLVPAVRALQTSLPESLRQLPIFSGPPLGVGMLSATLILAVMVVPFTSSVAREVLKSVPLTQREAAYALGATRFEAISAAIFYARTGIVGAVMLGFGRALGETMAVTMVIGNNPQVSTSLFAPQYTMAAVLANEFTEAADELYLHALIEIGLVLFVITLIVNGLSRLLIWSMARSAKPSRVPSSASAAPAGA